MTEFVKELITIDPAEYCTAKEFVMAVNHALDKIPRSDRVSAGICMTRRCDSDHSFQFYYWRLKNSEERKIVDWDKFDRERLARRESEQKERRRQLYAELKQEFEGE